MTVTISPNDFIEKYGWINRPAINNVINVIEKFKKSLDENMPSGSSDYMNLPSLTIDNFEEIEAEYNDAVENRRRSAEAASKASSTEIQRERRAAEAAARASSEASKKAAQPAKDEVAFKLAQYQNGEAYAAHRAKEIEKIDPEGVTDIQNAAAAAADHAQIENDSGIVVEAKPDYTKYILISGVAFIAYKLLKGKK